LTALKLIVVSSSEQDRVNLRRKSDRPRARNVGDLT